MKCPKCEIGTMKKVFLSTSGERGWVCDICETFWLEDEVINETTGHVLSAFAKADELDYEVVGLDEEDQDHQALPQEEKYRKFD